MIKDLTDKLYNTYQDDKNALIEIENSLHTFSDYLNIAYKEEIQNALKKSRKEHEEKDKTYDAVLSSLGYLNELCRKNGLPLFFEDDLDSREEVENFIRKCIISSFDNRYK